MMPMPTSHIPKDERGKLDSKARKCILLGYGRDRKGYRLYDPVQQKILHSRDVRFNEAEKTEAVTGDSAGVEADRHLVVDFSDPDVGTPNSTVEPILRRSARLKEKEVPDGELHTCQGFTVNQYRSRKQLLVLTAWNGCRQWKLK